MDSVVITVEVKTSELVTFKALVDSQDGLATTRTVDGFNNRVVVYTTHELKQRVYEYLASISHIAPWREINPQ